MKKVLCWLLKSPLLWGGLGAFGFYALLDAGAFASLPMVERYVAGHPVEYVTTVMFFVALASLVLRTIDTQGQWWRLWRSVRLLGTVPAAPQPAASVGALRERLRSHSGLKPADALARRMDDVLDHVERQGSGERLDEQLRYLSEMEAVRAHESGALFRIIVWAIPILGFLGTVMGITIAIANLDPTTLEESMNEVTLGLAVAFDTTALALALSLVLMFGKFFVDSLESRLFAAVDRRADAELLGRFETEPGGPNGELVAMVRRTVGEMVRATETLVQKQAALWQESLAAGEKRWSAAAAEESRRWQAGLKEGLTESFRVHSEQLIEAEKQTIKSNHRHWSQVQESLERSAASVVSLQQAMTTQAETLTKAIEAAGRVSLLQETLNKNLAALAGSHDFEKTVMSLAAAIHLLNGRLGDPDIALPRPQRAASTGKAA